MASEIEVPYTEKEIPRVVVHDVIPQEPEMWFPSRMNDTYQLAKGDQSPTEYFVDTRELPYIGEIKEVAIWEVTVKVVFYTLIISIALIGNLSVVFIVWRNKRMWTTTNFYIVNLAVSDLMIVMSCQWVHLVDDLTEGWVLGAFFCKFNSFAQVLSLVCSILTLTVISCDRFFGIVFAMKAHLTERKARVFIVAVWISSICISSPLLAYRTQEIRVWVNHTEIWCADTWPGVQTVHPVYKHPIVTYPSRTVYYTFVSVVLYFLPIFIMSFAYIFIILKLWSKRQPGVYIDSGAQLQNRRKKKVVVMLVTILSVFALCWLPLQVTILYSEYRSDPNHPLPGWYNHFRYFATFLAYANSAINPVIYTCFSDSFRQGFRDTFLYRSQYRAVSVKLAEIDGPSSRNHHHHLYHTVVTKV